MNNEDLNQKKEAASPGVVNYYAGLAIDIILLYALNNIRYLNSSILIKDEYVSCLWAINLALGMGIMGNFVLLLYQPLWFYHLIQGLLNALVVLALFVIYYIFPLNLNNTLQTIIKVIMIIVMSGVGIGFIVEIIKFISALTKRHNSPQSPATIEPPAMPQQ